MPEFTMAPTSQNGEQISLKDGRRKSADKKLGTDELSKLEGPTSLESEFADITPKNLSESDKERFLNGVAAAKFVSGFDAAQIRKDFEKTSELVAAQSHDKQRDEIDRLAVLKYARQARAEALKEEPMASLDSDIKRQFVNAVRHAREVEKYSHDDVKKSLVDLIVKADGDKDKAAAAFIEVINKSRPGFESGHLRNQSFTIDDPDKFDAIDNIVSLKAAKNAAVDDERTNSTGVLRKALESELDAKTAEQRQKLDVTAAAVFKSKSFTAYKVILESDDAVESLRKNLHVSRTQAFDYVKNISETLKNEVGKHDASELTKEQKARLSAPTAELIEKFTKNRQAETIEKLNERRDAERLAAKKYGYSYYLQKKAEQQREKERENLQKMPPVKQYNKDEISAFVADSTNKKSMQTRRRDFEL